MKELPHYACDGKVDSTMNGNVYDQRLLPASGIPDHYLWCHVCNCYHDHVQAKSTACSNINVNADFSNHDIANDDIDLTP